MKFAKPCILIVALMVVAAAHAQTKHAAAPAAAAAVTPVMKPGLWEIVQVDQAPNAIDKRTTTSRICYSADDLKVSERFLPPHRDFSVKCQNRDIKSNGTESTWKVSCTGKDSTRSGAGKMASTADSYTAQVALDVKTKGKATKLEQNVTGKWVGECK